MSFDTHLNTSRLSATAPAAAARRAAVAATMRKREKKDQFIFHWFGQRGLGCVLWDDLALWLAGSEEERACAVGGGGVGGARDGTGVHKGGRGHHNGHGGKAGELHSRVAWEQML